MDVNLMSVKISYSKDVDGKQKKINENYLVSGWSFGVTEKSIEDFFTKECYENLIVEDISRTKIEEFVPNEKLEEPKFYSLKTATTYLDDNGKEKIQKHTYLIASDSTENATNSFKNYMANSTEDFTIVGVVETNVLDIFLSEADWDK
jgi:hypothetical protein